MGRQWRSWYWALLPWLVSSWLHAQSAGPIWLEGRVPAIHMTLPADSLDSLLADTYGTRYYTATFVFDDGTARDTLSQVGMRLRGNTSRTAEKPSFKLSFNEFVPGRRYQAVKKLNLNSEHNDPTMVREKLFYDIWAASGMPPRRSGFMRLYVNGTFRGLYNCLEELDKDWLMRVFGENDGNLYKCTYPADMVYLGPNQATYKAVASSTATGGRAYDLQTNEALDDYSDLVALITQLDRNPDAAFAADILGYLSVEGMLRALAIDVATGNWDDYAYNKNNYFLYHTAAGPFAFITYDTDNTLGVDWVQRDWATRDCADWLTHSQPRPMASKLLDVPTYRSRYYAILDSITRHITRPDSIFPRIDSLEALLAPWAALDSFRTLDYGYTLADFHLGFTGTVDGHTPYGIKPFLQTRHASTLGQLAAVSAPSPSTDGWEGIVVAPNPVAASEALRVVAALPRASDLELTLLDAMGRTCRRGTLRAQEQAWDCATQGLASGTYTLRVAGKGIQGSLRVILL